MSTSNFSSGLRWPEALQMIGNCCKLTVIFVAGNPFVDEAWLKMLKLRMTQGIEKKPVCLRSLVVQQCQHHGYEIEWSL